MSVGKSSAAEVSANGDAKTKSASSALPADIDSIFFFHGWRDVFARVCFCGIFVVENIFHLMYFDQEIDGLVAPALSPLPRELAVALHTMHIVLGMFGAVFVILSGFDTAGRTALRKGCKMMLIFMLTITWTWLKKKFAILKKHLRF